MDRIPSALVWRKSSLSAQQDNCVEVAVLPGEGRAIRDSKNPSGLVLCFASNEWRTFIDSVKTGCFST